VELNGSQQSTDFSSQPRRAVYVYRWLMKKIMGRLNDWRRERRIRFLAKCVIHWYAQGCTHLARRFDQFRTDEIKSRSPEQVERMERRMGLR
jgi:hypothetical protein